MKAVKLRAHFDGEHIVLDEPCDLPIHTPLSVTVAPEGLDAERLAWSEWSRKGLARAYGDEEPSYSTEDIKPEKA